MATALELPIAEDLVIEYQRRGAVRLAGADIDGNPDRYDILQWDLAPGDALCFSFRTLHGAPGELVPIEATGFLGALGRRRRALYRAARPDLASLSRHRSRRRRSIAERLVSGDLEYPLNSLLDSCDCRLVCAITPLSQVSGASGTIVVVDSGEAVQFGKHRSR